jgi:hypothetical protein
MRHRFLFFCALLPGWVAACTRQTEQTTAVEVRAVNEVGHESDRTAVSEASVDGQPKRGFKDYVKHPDLFRKEMREREGGKPSPPTDQELTKLVAEMGRRPLEYTERQRLVLAGDRIVPPLQSALRDEKFLFHRYGKDKFAASTIEAALDLLELFALPAASVLEPALRHQEEYFRYRALYHLAQCGNDDAIPALKAGLASTSESCRTYALMGLEFLKRTGRGSTKFRAELFDGVVPLLADKEYGPSEHAPRALLVLDEDRAKRVLLGGDVLHPENERLSRVLQALKDASIMVPAAQLRALLSGIKKKAKDYPFDYAYADALVLLARSDGSKANELIEDARTWGNDQVKQGAADALVIATGVTNAYGFVIDKYQKKGVKALTEPQLYFLTLSWLDAEVQNGGFSQYYFNSSGELAAHAVKAAKAVGATELAGIIREANALFGTGGPDQDRDKRMDQLSKIDQEALHLLDSRYYKCPEKMDELLPRFVAAHATDFKPGP